MPTPAHDPYSALRLPDFRRHVAGSTLGHLGGAMQTVAVGWSLYERTGSALALGLVGLVQVLPMLLLAVPGGHVADRVDRRRLVLATQSVVIACSLALAVLTLTGGAVAGIYACLAITACARAFGMPANASLWPTLVPPALYSNAVTWRSGSFHVASIAGPALGGVLIGWQHSAVPAYLADAALTLIYWLCIYRITPPPTPGRAAESVSWESLLAGVRFVGRTKVILGAVLLDMFAVLFGGATALLPIYARDILHVGPAGFGLLRGAPAAGAVVMALVLAHRPPLRRSGRALLWAVAGFGVATIVFGLSRSFWLSLGALALTGALDNISVVVRHSLVQLRTPDGMRGRVTAVNGVCISCSNELGEFESGVVAALFGPVIAVVSGGIGTLLVVAVAAWRWPELRRLDRLHEPGPEP